MKRFNRGFNNLSEIPLMRTLRRSTCVLAIFVALLAIVPVSALSAALIRMKPGPEPAAAATRQDSGQSVEMTQMVIARRGHSATPLGNGRIILIGGENESGAVSASEIFDPISGTFCLGAKSLEARADHTAVLLTDGRVLVVGGRSGSSRLLSTEIYDPISNSFSKGPSLKQARAGHTGSVLSDGRFLVLGGEEDGTAEIFDPATQSFTLLNARMITVRSYHAAIQLLSGKVLMAGGLDLDGNPLSSAEIFDPQGMSFSAVSNEMHTQRTSPALRVLPDGKVQVIGGDDESTMEMFNVEREYFTAYAHLVSGPEWPGIVLSSTSRAALFHLTRGGTQDLQSAAAQTEASDAITQVTNRIGYSLTELPDSGRVLVAGGSTDTALATPTAAIIRNASGATITTDKTDYQPGETVVMTGSGFQPGETVQLLLTRDPKTSEDTQITPSVANESGNFVNSTFTVSQTDLGITFTLTATGQSSGRTAQTNFTDGPSTPCNIGNFVWEDKNANGTQDSGEPIRSWTRRWQCYEG